MGKKKSESRAFVGKIDGGHDLRGGIGMGIMNCYSMESGLLT